MSDNSSTSNYWVLIPPAIYSDPNLSDKAKFLYGRILALAHKDGFCYATNRFFATEFNLKRKATISEYIQELRREGYIEVEIIYAEDGKAVQQRKITPLLRKNVRGITEKRKGGITEKRKVYKESIRNKSIREETRFHKKVKPSGLREKTSFPKQWYGLCLNAYQTIKGISLKGGEIKPAQQTLKSMFMSDRKPHSIIAFMRWLENSPAEWTQNWTLGTVKMKMPEWDAGKLGKIYTAPDGRTFRERFQWETYCKSLGYKVKNETKS